MTPDEPELVLLARDDAPKPDAPAKAAAIRSRAAAPRARPKATVKPRRPRKSSARARKPAGQDPIRLLAGLRASWQDTLAAHRVRGEGRFREAERKLRSGRRIKARDLERVRADLKVHLKPRKGRAKDLRRVEAALDAVLGRVGGD